MRSCASKTSKIVNRIGWWYSIILNDQRFNLLISTGKSNKTAKRSFVCWRNCLCNALTKDDAWIIALIDSKRPVDVIVRCCFDENVCSNHLLICPSWDVILISLWRVSSERISTRL